MCACLRIGERGDYENKLQAPLLEGPRIRRLAVLVRPAGLEDQRSSSYLLILHSSVASQVAMFKPRDSTRQKLATGHLFV